MVDDARLYEDGYNDGFAGRVALDRQFFDGSAAYKMYMKGYATGDAARQKPKLSRPAPYTGLFARYTGIACSGATLMPSVGGYYSQFDDWDKYPMGT